MDLDLSSLNGIAKKHRSNSEIANAVESLKWVIQNYKGKGSPKSFCISDHSLDSIKTIFDDLGLRVTLKRFPVDRTHHSIMVTLLD